MKPKEQVLTDFTASYFAVCGHCKHNLNGKIAKTDLGNSIMHVCPNCSTGNDISLKKLLDKASK
jgi:hypothetical protein